MVITKDVHAKEARLPSGKTKVKISAGAGLYMVINSSGKYWRYAYSYCGKRKESSLGVYRLGSEKHLSLKLARSKAQAVKDQLDVGIDPNQTIKDKKLANKTSDAEKKRQVEEDHKQVIAESRTFKVVGLLWFEKKKAEWVESHTKKQIGRLERHLFPTIGDIPIAKITKLQVSETIEAISRMGSNDLAHRMAQVTRSILNYACNKGFIEAVPMGDMSQVLTEREQTKMPAIIEPARIGELMRAIYSYQGSFVVCQALKLFPLLAARTGEFRTAEWIEFDLDAELWTIPAAHRKLKKKLKENPENVQLVPLSRQSIALLKELHAVTGAGRLAFPSIRGDSRPMSENTINTALHAMGFKGEMVGHGVRAMFSTLMNNKDYNPDAIERQLSHAESNIVRGKYNRGEYMSARTKIMQDWADYIDTLRKGAKVIPIKRKA
ncbi:MAG: tyrosine-type recombinase/integrase [Mariprofundaceae bacterium]|nr:tyrosine-type recombinase/integrase [Mariprofundaceae bacterium]